MLSEVLDHVQQYGCAREWVMLLFTYQTTICNSCDTTVLAMCYIIHDIVFDCGDIVFDCVTINVTVSMIQCYNNSGFYLD